jgi:hypothetical protein
MQKPLFELIEPVVLIFPEVSIVKAFWPTVIGALN